MKPITALTGPNETYKREYLSKLLAKTPKEEVTVFFADETSPAEIFSHCAQNTLFGSKSTVIVKNIGAVGDRKKSDFEDALEKYLLDPNPDTNLVLLADQFSKGLLSLLTDKGEVMDYKKPYRNDLVSFLNRKFTESGIRFDRDLPDFIVTLANEDSEDAAMMAGLLVRFAAGAEKPLSVAEASTLLSRSNNMNIFDLIEGIFKKDARKALCALTDLRLAGEPLPKISYMILRSAKLLWAYLALPDKKNAEYGLGIKPYEARRVADYARSCDMKFVSAALEMVRRLEQKTKTMADDFAYAELENFILASAPKT